MPSRFIALLLAALLFIPAALAAEGPAPLIEEMQAGGLVIYWRHAKTDRSQRDTDLSDINRCETQRNLNAEGRREARRVGQAFERHGIPVGDVLTSDFCRNRDTAELAFGRYERLDGLFNLPATRDPARRERLVSALREMLATPPADAAENTVIVGHNLNLRAAANVFVDEGGIAVFQPLGGDGFRHLGSLRPEDL
ncbi:histidine phosphatase family protein [Thioalkalivibrio sp.]|uniref:histidine phosphatase family protein n=1 Tax=Thioalkalivibrio sp. TaxID=2093813 RepID=UPI0035698939